MHRRRELFAALTLGTLLLVLAGAASLVGARRLNEATTRRKEQFLVLGNYRLLVNHLQDAQRGQRGFLLTGRDAYLAPFVSGSTSAVHALASLDSAPTLPGQQARLALLDSLTERLFIELNRAIAVRRAEGLPAALDQVERDADKRIMDSLQGVVAGLQQVTLGEIDRWDAATARLSGLMLGVIPATCGLAVLFLLISGHRLHRELTARERAELALQEANDGLERQVAHRTAELKTANDDLRDTIEELQAAEEELRQQNDELLRSEETLRVNEEKLRRALDQWRALVEASPSALVELDREGRVTAWPGAAARMFGWRAEEVLGQPLPLAPPDLAAEYEGLRQQPVAGVTITDHETRGRRRDGATLAVSVSCAPLRDAAGQVAGQVQVYTDITERRRLEEEQRGREVAEAANRSKSQFLANMSHELRTPLNAIIGFSELLEDRAFGDLNERQLRYVGNILTSGRHLLDLINDVLDLAKIEAGRLSLDRSTFSPAGAIQEVRRIVEPLAMAQRLTLEIDAPAGLPQLVADRAKFKQVLYNLLSNAIKFTPEGGRVEVRAREVADAALGSEGPVLEVSVADTGVGIAPEDQERIFREFEQVDSSYARRHQGTGLGLALTRRLVELHGGRITVASAPGAGSRFTVVLPLDQAESAAPPPPPAPAPEAAPGDRPLVLVVEDDPIAGELLAHYLTEHGFAVAHAWNAAQALEAAQRLRPAAITLDILLPDQDGLQVLSRLRSLGETSGIPVVVVSITDDREIGFSLGAVDWLVKPVQRAQLLDALEQALPAQPLARPVVVLVVDDHRETVDLLAEALARRGFEPLRAYGGIEGLELARRARPEAIVLDLVMPDLGGLEVLQRLYQDPGTRDIPVLLFSFRDLHEEERVALPGNVHMIVSKSRASDLLLALRRLARRLVSQPRAAPVEGS